LFGIRVGTTTYAGPVLQAFGAGATIDLKNFGAAGAVSTLSSAGLLQIANTANQKASLMFQTSSLGTGSFHIAGDGGTGSLLTLA
jgi:hypothetical protein